MKEGWTEEREGRKEWRKEERRERREKKVKKESHLVYRTLENIRNDHWKLLNGMKWDEI